MCYATLVLNVLAICSRKGDDMQWLHVIVKAATALLCGLPSTQRASQMADVWWICLPVQIRQTGSL